MSSELLIAEEGHPPGARNGHVEPSRRTRRWSRTRRAHGPINRWWIRTHRWTSLTLGLLFILEATSGAVLLYGNDLARALHPERYIVTPSATPMTQLDALNMVRASHPELKAAGYRTTRASTWFEVTRRAGIRWTPSSIRGRGESTASAPSSPGSCCSWSTSMTAG